jgi:hypothetical protein
MFAAIIRLKGETKMTLQDMISELDTLSVDEQLQLLQALTQRLQQSVRDANSHTMLGVFGVNRDVSKDEIKDVITDYLTEKYK